MTNPSPPVSAEAVELFRKRLWDVGEQRLGAMDVKLALEAAAPLLVRAALAMEPTGPYRAEKQSYGPLWMVVNDDDPPDAGGRILRDLTEPEARAVANALNLVADGKRGGD